MIFIGDLIWFCLVSDKVVLVRERSDDSEQQEEGEEEEERRREVVDTNDTREFPSEERDDVEIFCC